MKLLPMKPAPPVTSMDMGVKVAGVGRPLVTRNVRNFDNLPGVVVLGVLSVVPQSVFVNAP